MKIEEPLSKEERKILLKIARNALTNAVLNNPQEKPNPRNYQGALAEKGATFVTLTIDGNLRGCIGTLEAYQSLVEDVHDHAIAAGLQDYRFPPVSPAELDRIAIEISRLTKPQKLAYSSPDDLVAKLHPGKDGVILAYKSYRATFLPQVWRQLPKTEEFLEHLCMKMGLMPDAWKTFPMDVFVYHVEEFSEEELKEEQ